MRRLWESPLPAIVFLLGCSGLGYLALRGRGAPDPGFDADMFAGMPEEIRLRLLLRAIDRASSVLEAARSSGAVEGSSFDRIAEAYEAAAREALAKGALEVTSAP